jgi:hypothetical protein
VSVIYYEVRMQLICYFVNSDMGDSPSENLHDDIDSEVYPSEDGKYLIFCVNVCDALMISFLRM